MKDLGEAGAANAMFRKGFKTLHSMLLSKSVGERQSG